MSKCRYYGYGEITLGNVDDNLNPNRGMLSKPNASGCIWASRTDAYIPWEEIATPDFIYAPHRMTQAILEKSYIDFDVDDSKIYHIRSLEDVLKYCLNVNSIEDFERLNIWLFAIDFNRLREDGYAGCEYHYSEDKDHLNDYLLWDCDSIVIWNCKDVISNITYSSTYQSEYSPNPSLYPSDALSDDEEDEYEMW